MAMKELKEDNIIIMQQIIYTLCCDLTWTYS